MATINFTFDETWRALRLRVLLEISKVLRKPPYLIVCCTYCSDVSLAKAIAIREGLVLLLIADYETMLLRAFLEWLLIEFCCILISCIAPPNIIISDFLALASIVEVFFSNMRRDGNWVTITLLIKPFVRRVRVNGFQNSWILR